MKQVRLQQKMQKYKGSKKKNYYKQLYANKMDNLEEMDTFLERDNLSRLNQEEIENMSIPITSNEIETLIFEPQTNKTDSLSFYLSCI